MRNRIIIFNFSEEDMSVCIFFISDINYLPTYMLYLQDFNNHGMFFFQTIDRKILWNYLLYTILYSVRSKRGSTKVVFSPSILEPQIDFHGELIGAIFTYEGQMLPKLGSFTCGDVAAAAVK